MFDALPDDRPHRPSRSLDEAVEIIKGKAGKPFDPAFADLLTRVAAQRRSDRQARIDTALHSLRAAAEAVEGRTG